MFSYYGSKSKIVHLYPVPKYPKIIEPFAGSARYSLRYFDHDVLLVDKYDVIVNLWKWLQKCSKQDILSLPDMYEGDSLDSFDLPLEAKSLIGFCINQGSAQPKTTAQLFNGWHRDRSTIAHSIEHVKAWNIQLGSYTDIPNQEATWFIDPPYQFGGEYYKLSNKDIDYMTLAEWCKSRKGQVIVCENTKANWLPFRPVAQLHGSKYNTTEAVWYNDLDQPRLFELT